MAVNFAAGNYFRDRMAEDELRKQELERRQQEKQHSKGWWKRGLGQGILGALPGLVTLNPVMAAAGAAGGFGGEAVNHFAFKDKQPGIAGNAAALAALGSGAASKGLFSAAGDKVGLEGLQRGAANMGNNAAYNAEIAKASMPIGGPSKTPLNVGFGNGNTPQQMAQSMMSPANLDVGPQPSALDYNSNAPEAIKFQARGPSLAGQKITDYSGAGDTSGFITPDNGVPGMTEEEYLQFMRLYGGR